MSDEEIIEHLRSSDERTQNLALKVILKDFKAIAKSLAFKKNIREEIADPIFYEAIEAFYLKVKSPSFEQKAKLSTFFYAICDRMMKNWLTKGKVKEDRQDSIESFGERLLVEEEEDQTEKQVHLSQALKQCIQTLGERCQQILLLFYWEGLTDKEIQEYLEFSNIQVFKNQKFRCRERLKKCLGTDPRQQEEFL